MLRRGQGEEASVRKVHLSTSSEMTFTSSQDAETNAPLWHFKCSQGHHDKVHIFLDGINNHDAYLQQLELNGSCSEGTFLKLCATLHVSSERIEGAEWTTDGDERSVALTRVEANVEQQDKKHSTWRLQCVGNPHLISSVVMAIKHPSMAALASAKYDGEIDDRTFSTLMNLRHVTAVDMAIVNGTKHSGITLLDGKMTCNATPERLTECYKSLLQGGTFVTHLNLGCVVL